MTLGNNTWLLEISAALYSCTQAGWHHHGGDIDRRNCVFTTWNLHPYSDPQNHVVSFAQVQRSDDPVHDLDMSASTPRASPLDLAAREGHLHHRAMWRAPT